MHLSTNCDFLGSVGLQETHMDALKPFNSKYIALTMRGGFFTKFKALAHGGPPLGTISMDQTVPVRLFASVDYIVLAH